MKLDILIITYNSSKWLDNCINSIMASDYNMKDITLIFLDNMSTDNTVSVLKKYQKKYKSQLNDFIVKENYKNDGFGIGNNKAAELGKSPYLFIYNVDTEMYPDTLKKIDREISQHEPKVVMWELRQEPFEHPKYYDPVTNYTSWASGACVIIKREVFEAIGGFDKNIFMYCEDVDLSWAVRARDYKIKYLPSIPIQHFSYGDGNQFKINQFFYGFFSNWYLRAKYGSFRRFAGGAVTMARLAKGYFIPIYLDSNTKRKIRRKALGHLIKYFPKYFFINRKKKSSDFTPTFKELDFETQGEGAFYLPEKINKKPLVSIIVRTCNRPEALREALTSISRQSYSNYEVIVVEDGEPHSREMIKNEFGYLNINYYCAGKNQGRSKAGNIGMKLAKGKYFNFLDDDDAFYYNHIEVLVDYMERNQINIAYSAAFETKIDITSRSPYKYKVKSVNTFVDKHFSKNKLYKRNFIPIQSIMFNKEVFEKKGGFDEEIEFLEDWDLWIRYSLDNYFYYVDKTTSVFRTPYQPEDYKKRQEALDASIDYLKRKFEKYIPKKTVLDYYMDDENDS